MDAVHDAPAKIADFVHAKRMNELQEAKVFWFFFSKKNILAYFSKMIAAPLEAPITPGL